jgi:hypothetical protein
MPESIKDASLEGTTNIKGAVKVAPGTRVSGLHKSHVGLDKVDNTSDYYKPVSYYTELHVKAKISDLIGNAPETLNTLKEIADAIGNNPTEFSDINTLIGQKAPKESPALTGAPTAPTASVSTNTDQIATTKFVKSQDYATNPGVSAALGQKADTIALTYKANLASPEFTGEPTAPTASANTSTTQLATTAFVASGLAAKANLAGPTTFSGTTTIANAVLTSAVSNAVLAVGDDSTKLATTAFVQSKLGLKANLASPEFTGVPKADTAATGTSTTQLATTAFVASGLALKAPLASPAFTGQPTGVFSFIQTLEYGSSSDVPGTIVYSDSDATFYFCVKRADGIGVWKKLKPLAV